MADLPTGTTSATNNGSIIGIAATAKYNPHLWSSDELRAIFVARKRELETILQVIKSAMPGVAPQHMLITGQRGMGKSTLLQRVALAVEDDPKLHPNWLPLRFPEEQYTVSSPAELWANVIGALADALERRGEPTLDIDSELTRQKNMPKELREASSLDWINQWCNAHKRRLLLLMDSTDMLFANLAGSDASKRSTQQEGGASSLWRVRKALMHSPNLMWLGGSYQPLEAHGLYSDAFLDFFQLIELRPLTLVEMQNAILAMARLFGAGRGLKGDDAEAEVLSMLNRRPERLRAMRQLSGGNPRTTVMLYELFAAGGKDSVRADLERLLDAMTPLYKARLEVLADQPRKVLAHVMENWAPITAKALAKAAALAVGTVSAQLSRLEQEGLVGKTALSGTKRLGYECTERFFNIWYLMRNAPRGARSRVGWLVEFMRLWYSDDELKGLARTRWTEHREGLLLEAPDLEYSRAIARALPDKERDRQQLEWSVFQQARKGPAYKEIFDLDGEDSSYSGPDDYLTRFEALQAGLVKAPLASDDCLHWAEEVKRAMHLSLFEKESLAKQCSQTSTTELGDVRTRLAQIRERFIANHDQVSVEHVECAVANGFFFPDCPESSLALTQLIECFETNPSAFAAAVGRLVVRSSDVNAELACKKSIELAPTSARPLTTFGNLLAKQPSRLDEAEAAYRKAIEIDPKWAPPWEALGDLLAKQPSRLDEAEAAYRKAIEIDPKWAGYWGGLGFLLANQPNRLDEAEAAYRKAIEINPKWAGYWGGLGELLANQPNRLDEAEAAYRKAIEIDPKWDGYWGRLGALLANQPNRLDEAEAAYLKAIEIDPMWAGYWGVLGALLANQPSRLAEAEAAYRKAVEIDPKLAGYWGVLGLLLAKQPSRLEEAEAAYRKVIEIDPNWAWPWGAVGDLLAKQPSRLEEAEAAYRRAIEIDPKSATPWGRLGDLLEKQPNRLGEAEAAYRKVIEIDPKLAWPWGTLGNLLENQHKRVVEAEAAYRKAIEIDPKWHGYWMRLGNLLQDKAKRFAEAEEAYREATALAPTNPFPLANMARLLAATGRKHEASDQYRRALAIAGDEHHNFRLQAHCWLGNNDLAMQSLDKMAEQATMGNRIAFYELKEQCFECHAIGFSKPLADLMERSRFADFLMPFALALRAANGEKGALLDAAVEVRGIAEEVLAQIEQKY